MKILITAPSLDESRNVSGISTVVRQIMEHGTFDYLHFTAGRRDGEKASLLWLLKQAVMPLQFYSQCLAHYPDAVHINTALTDLSIWRDAILTLVAKMAGHRVVLAIHGGRYLMDDFTSPRLARVTEKMLRRASVILVLSETEKQSIERRWQGLDIRVLPNAVAVPKLPRRESNTDVPSLLFFGRLHESKGLEELTAACRILRGDGVRFRLNCYGDGPLRENFVAGMTAVLGEDFHYGGVVAGNEKWRKYNDADIFVLPSRYGEGLPMALLEAMGTGCLAVASEMASVASVITDGVNGYLIAPGDADAIADKLKFVIENRAGWKAIGKNAAATVKEKFAIAEYIEKLEGIYREGEKVLDADKH
jgi:glycosyltransferase involved in cell wall biosynthesis